jgi:hypothetical protein
LRSGLLRGAPSVRARPKLYEESEDEDVYNRANEWEEACSEHAVPL